VRDLCSGRSGQARSSKANLPHTILEVRRATEDFDFHAHKKHRQIPAIDLGEPNGIFLGGDDGLGLALFAPVDDVENFLLGEPVVIGKPLGINQLRADLDKARTEKQAALRALTAGTPKSGDQALTNAQNVAARDKEGAALTEKLAELNKQRAELDYPIALAELQLREGVGRRLGYDPDIRMAEAAVRHCDEIIVTSDNPRTEKPGDIIEQILDGVPLDFPHWVIADRRAAIAKGLGLARPGDCVIIAGKGRSEERRVGKEC
jgi:hypothetical protein